MGIEWSQLPLVLAGPIVRRVEPTQVSVWVALQERAEVTLDVFAASPGVGSLRASGRRHTVELAPRLHVVLVTARPPEGGAPLEWAGCFLYDLRIRTAAGTQRLQDDGVLTVGPEGDPLRRVVLQGMPMPSFVLPGASAESLRFVHGSCRKPHGAGVDALRTLSDVLDGSTADPSSRPAALFMTGDQIYADDVHQALRDEIILLADSLGGGADPERSALHASVGEAFEPGHRRGQFLRDHAGITSSEAKGHLVTLREFYAMYLTVWSDVFWPGVDGTHDELRPFRRRLGEVRRALANIATYTVFDDHEVTDDWYLTRAWVERVTATDLGRRIIRNALVSYALFQHWGTDPAAFEDEQPGGALLRAVSAWDPNDSARSELVEGAIFVPKGVVTPNSSPSGALKWHWSLDWPEVSVVGLDTRTRRGFRGKFARPALMNDAALDEVLGPLSGPAPNSTKRVSVVISAAPVLGLRFIEVAQDLAAQLLSARTVDAESWSLDADAFAGLLGRLARRRRVIVLSGDVHFAFAAVARPQGASADSPVVVNFTASGFQNQSFGAVGSLVLRLAAARRATHGASGLPKANALETSRELAIDGGFREELVPAATDGGEPGDWEGVVGSANIAEVLLHGDDLLQRLFWRDGDGAARVTIHRVAGFLT